MNLQLLSDEAHIRSITLLLSLLLMTISESLSLSTIKFGACRTLGISAEDRLLNPCVGVVDYPYFLEDGMTENMIVKAVNASLNTTIFSNLDVNCQGISIRDICARHYLKCVENVELSNISTYDTSIYATDFPGSNVPLPYMRPCGYVCTDIKSACPALYKFSFGDPNCDVLFDYSYGNFSEGIPYRYALNNQSCFAPNIILPSGPVESYLRGPEQPCSGLVDKFLIPPASKLNSSFSPIQLPFITQALMNQALSKSLKVLPPWLEYDCRKAALQRICTTVFLHPELVTIERAFDWSDLESLLPTVNALHPGIISSAIYVPSFPNRSICFNFENSCAGIISNSPSMRPNCSETLLLTNTLVQKYPIRNQTVGSTVLKSQSVLMFPSQPYTNPYFSEEEYYNTIDCPPGFVVPEHPQMQNVINIQNTACALGCLSPLWNSDEWKSSYTLTRAVSILGTIFGFGLLFFLMSTGDAKKMYHISIYTVFATVASLYSAIFTISNNLQSAFCYDNAVNSTQSSNASSPCVIQGVILLYCIHVCCIDTLMMMIHRYMILAGPKTQQITTTSKYYAIQFFVIFVLPIIPVTYAGANKALGFSRQHAWCFMMPSPYYVENEDIAFVALPMLVVNIITITGFIILECILKFFPASKRFSTVVPIESEEQEKAQLEIRPFENEQNSGSDNGSDASADQLEGQIQPEQEMEEQELDEPSLSPMEEALQRISVPAIIFLVIFVFCLPIILQKLFQYKVANTYRDSLRDWARCVFSNYRGTDAYLQVCGSHAKLRPSKALTRAIMVSLMGSMTVVCPFYLLLYCICRCQANKVNSF